MPFTRNDAWNLCAALNGPDSANVTEGMRAFVLGAIGAHIRDVLHEAATTEVRWNADTSEWLTKDGYRWLPRNNLGGLGPMGMGLAVLDILDGEPLDRTKVYHYGKWVWRQE